MTRYITFAAIHAAFPVSSHPKSKHPSLMWLTNDIAGPHSGATSPERLANAARHAVHQFVPDPVDLGAAQEPAADHTGNSEPERQR